MLDPVLLSSVTAALVIFMTLLLVLIWRKVNVLAQSNADQIKAELVNLLERNDETLKSGLNDSRKELRDVSSENRREMNDLFKAFQDTLLKRVMEISGEQNRQLTNFKDALNALSERLISNSNEFKQSVSESFSASSAALNSKQDEFRERTLERLNAFQEGIQVNAKDNRQELNNSLKSFEEKFAQSIKDLVEQLQGQFIEFNKQQDAFGEKTIGRLNGFQEGIQKDAKENRQELNTALKSFEEKSAQAIKQLSDHLQTQFVEFNKQQDALGEKTISRLNGFQESIQNNAKENRQELNTTLKSFEEKSALAIKQLSDHLQTQFVGFNKQQDAFSEKSIGRLNGFQEGIQKDAKENRQELNTALKSFEEKSAQAIKQLSDHLQTQFVEFNKQQDAIGEKTIGRLNGFQESIQNNAKENRQELNDGLKSFETKFGDGIKDFNEQLRLRFSDLNKQQLESLQQSKTSITEVKDTIEKQLKAIREDNTTQLNEMRRTVDEKLHDTLEKRLGESFKLVSDRLEQVHKGLGEMQTLAVGVGDLKKVLSNVKTRGILGEYQLGNILEQILSPEQYSVNVATKQGSRENVEYAVKLPGKSDENTVWLPIDSKFPLESYQALLNALEEGIPGNIDAAQKLLLKAVENFAKDISTKYIDPPNTTDFAIMFLPVESLYAEVLRHPEMFERLQRTYRVTITGPTTLSALLNSLNMGFRTLAVQKRSSEVWKVLAEVKTEFVKYSEQLATVHKHLNTATTSLEKLQTTRTNAMARKLNSVDGLELELDGTPTLAVPVLEEDD